MKKALLCGLSAALLLALVLVACNKPQADQPTEPDPTPSAVQTQPVETPQPEETNEPINQVEQMSINTQQEVDTRREATLMDLLELFQTVYDCRTDWINLGESEEVLELLELEEVDFQVEAKPDVIFPSDIKNRYLEWKAINYGTTDPVSSEQQQQAANAAENSTTTTTQTGTPVSNPQTQPSGNNQPQPVSNQTSGGNTNNQQGSLVQQPTTGDLGVDVTGGKSPNDFLGIDDGTEARDSGAYLDMSKVGFGD